ncbi:MAG: alpha/beta hydrolase [Chloroflexaceae bacterium]|nr:alpha/beta hydrolase [Chloroflexaceae bacterium]NJL34121.1 alpha/beta hydrolase [Chloroflexaceae bacterium]NJO04721.1 alpha/beta hydrolase [Chloroflexaceae bacterium]
MSAIYLDNRMVHYEVFGRGQPILFLHSWLGSWRYWVPMMDLVAERYRAYAIDFWGFGDSDRRHGTYTIDEYAQMVRAFMDEMGIQKINVVGHGLGGMVAVQLAQMAPERVIRLVLVSTPMDGSILREVAKPGALSRLFGRSSVVEVWSKLIRQIPVDDPEVKQELYEDTDNLSEVVIQSVQDSMMETDLNQTLITLDDAIPLLAVYGEKDTIVPADHATVLNHDSGRPHQLVILPRANHFPFLEGQSTTFGRLLMDFMVSQGTPVEIKEQWRRRVSQREYL